jgi:sulfite oxidase
MLEGVRWKYYHYAMGPSLRDLPDISWKYVQKEKSPDMLHVLQFPYNGEPPRVSSQSRYFTVPTQLIETRTD